MSKLAMKYIDSVDGAAHQSAVEIITKLEAAFLIARNSAAGYSMYCEESASSRRCEKELEKADEVYNSIFLE